MPAGTLNSAEVAGPPSPQASVDVLHPAPVPAILVITPAGVILRSVWLLPSLTYTLPAGSTATPRGGPSVAAVAWPPSPHRFALKHPEPLPAIVQIVAGIVG